MNYPNRETEASDIPKVISPFAQTASTVKSSPEPRSRSWTLFVVSGLLVILLVAICGYFIMKYVDDPYRTMEQFPIAKYLDDYRTLAGAKFRADMKVSADLGWKDGVGRLMVFTPENDSRPVVVLIPPKLSGIYFTKGQDYQVSLEIGEGGLIYADSCEKE